jgi:tetratricopeptide (TPR) repeat protein
MEMWKWFENLTRSLHDAGQEASINILQELSDHVGELEIERADALLPEAKALAKSLQNPWLEVFVGHWEMRNRLDNKLEGESALPDVVALFERAHRADAIDCPQSVCATQDLVDCYTNIDEIGFAPENRAAIAETLQRIDPSWNCFICLSSLYASTLNAENRHEEALAWLETQENKLHAAGIDADLHSSRTWPLMELGRVEEALTILETEAAKDTDGDSYVWESDRQDNQVMHALALARLGRDEEAWATLPAWERTALPNQLWWIDTAAILLARAPERNTWQLGSGFQVALDQLSRNGSHRLLIKNALIVARLALSRGAHWNAGRLLTLARKHLPALKTDAGAAASLEALEAEIARTATPPLPVAADELMNWLGAQETRNPEIEIDWLIKAHQQRPDDEALATLTASAMQASGAPAEGENLLWAYLESHPDAAPDDVTHAATQLFNSWLQRGEDERIEQLARHFDTREPPFACWCRARLAARDQHWEEVIPLVETALRTEPRRESLLRLLAEALQKQQRFNDAASAWLRLADVLEEPRPALWDHMTCATAAGDWDAVRASAARLDFTFDSASGPINEDWEWVIIRYVENGDPYDYYARRTGPVTARIIENSVPRRAQHVLDEITFDATYLEPAPEDEEARKRFVYTYGFVHTLQPGAHGPSWQVEGVHPGEARLKALIETLEQHGHQVWLYDNDYEVKDQTNDQTLPGVYFTVASPPAATAHDLHKLLAQETSDLPHRLCWLRLAEHCGMDAAAQREIIERYGL